MREWSMAKAWLYNSLNNETGALATTRSTISLALGERQPNVRLASLEKAYSAHDLQMKYPGVDPGLDSLHGDLRFNDLMRRVGLKP